MPAIIFIHGMVFNLLEFIDVAKSFGLEMNSPIPLKSTHQFIIYC